MSLQDTAQNAPNAADMAAVEKVQDQLVKMYSGIFTSAMAYSNLIIVAGYGAMLAIWNLTKSHLTPGTTQTVAILLIVSIGVFVGFEIFKMVMTAVSTLLFSRLIKPGISLQDLQKLLDGHTCRAQKLHPYPAGFVDGSRFVVSRCRLGANHATRENGCQCNDAHAVDGCVFAAPAFTKR